MPESADRIGRARSFASVADDYELARPGYPAEAVSWLAGPTPRRVLDLGAGTGKLTRILVDLGHEVVAVEPLAAMLEHLVRAVPGVDALEGSAEAIPLPAASVEVVAVGQAFHWFDQPVALAEVARVLCPGGTLGLVWNMRDDREPWVAELSGAIGREALFSGWADCFEAAADFGPLERRDFAFSQELDPESLVARVRSQSFCATMPEEEQTAVLAHVREVCETHPDLAGHKTFTLPYVTETYRTRRVLS